MKTTIRIFSVFILLTLTFALSGFAFQQNNGILATAVATNNSTSGHGPNINSDSIIKDINNQLSEPDTSLNRINTRYKLASNRTKQQAASVRAYIKANNFSSDYIFLLDMSLPSGKKRFFVYNLKADSLESASLVAHGFGSTILESENLLTFSNSNSSYKTSLGKYKVGISYKGAYGLAYKLYGLDSTNSNAFSRAIVLHADAHIPANETYPYRIFQSAGCPAVTPNFLPILGNYIKASKKPILLWIYN